MVQGVLGHREYSGTVGTGPPRPLEALYPPELRRADGTGGLGYCSIVQSTLSHCPDPRLTEID